MKTGEHKPCENCGQQFARQKSASSGQWETKRFCSPGCNVTHAKTMREARAQSMTSALGYLQTATDQWARQ